MRSTHIWIAALGALGLGTGCTPQESLTPVVEVETYSDSAQADREYWSLVRDQLEGVTLELVPRGPSSGPGAVVLVAPLAPTSGLLDLGAWAPEALEAFFPVAVDPRLQGGRVTRLVPSVSATHVFFVNRGVLAGVGLEPAASYQELVAQVPILRASGLDVVLMANREPWVLEATLFSTLAGRLAGVDFLDGLRQGKTRFTDPGFVAALSLVQDLVADGVLSRQTLLVGSSEVAQPFAAGRAAYLIDGDWRIASLTTDPATGGGLLAPKDQGAIALSVFPSVPGEPPGAPEASVALGPGWGIPLGLGDRQKNALAVLETLEGAPAQWWRLKTRGVFPSRADVPLGLEPLEQARGHFYQGLTGTPVFEGHLPPSVLALLHQGLRALVLGTTRPDVLAQDLQEAWEGAF